MDHSALLGGVLTRAATACSHMHGRMAALHAAQVVAFPASAHFAVTTYNLGNTLLRSVFDKPCVCMYGMTFC